MTVMVGGGGAAIVFALSLAIFALMWITVIVVAGRWGAAVGKRKREESTTNTDRLRGLDVSAASALRRVDPPENLTQ